MHKASYQKYMKQKKCYFLFFFPKIKSDQLINIEFEIKQFFQIPSYLPKTCYLIWKDITEFWRKMLEGYWVMFAHVWLWLYHC